MGTFALDTGSSQDDIISGLNYALANLGQGTGTTANLGNVLTANVTTGNITTIGNSTVIGYLYQYMDVAYANTATGGSFSSNSQNKSYFGLKNITANVWDTNPVDYTWYQLAGGFGTTKSLYYQTTGGRQINFQAATTSPGYYYRSAVDSVPINLDNVSSTQTISTQAVYLDSQYTPATPTGGTFNFGNLYLSPPSGGWTSNIPNAGTGNVIYISENTFSSTQNFVVPPNGAWTFPVIFSANGATGANGLPGISTYYFPAYTTGNSVPATPINGSWNFANVSGTPPVDPNYQYIPYQYIKPSTITVTAGNTNVVSLANLTLGNTFINYNYYTVYANTYQPGPNTSYTVNTSIYGGRYITDFTVTGNTAYVDLLLVGAGGAGQASGAFNPYTFQQAGASGGNVRVVSNVALTTGNYRIVHGPGVDTTILKNDGSINYTATQGSSGFTNRGANVVAGYGGGLNGGARTPGTAYPIGTNDLTGYYYGGPGQPDPWNQITWVGQIAGNGVAYFGGGAGAGSPYHNPGATGGLGGGGTGSAQNPPLPSGGTPIYSTAGTFGTGGGGGGGPAGSSGSGYSNNFQGSIGYSVYDSYSVGGVAVIRQHNPLPANLIINTWTLAPTAIASNVLYSSYSVPSIAGNVGNVTTLTWSTPTQLSGNNGINGNVGNVGSQGSRGFIPMAYVVTSSDPTSYTTAEYTYAFSANRSNIAAPIGTGYTPIDGDVAQFVYPTTNVLVVKTFSANANVWGAVNGQVISGNVFVTGSINATALNANDVYALNIASTSAYGNVGDFTSPGFWLQASSGNARLAGNTSIGNSLTVGTNAVIGANLTVGANLIVGTNATVGANLNVGANANIGTSARIGNSLTVGTNATVGVNLNVGANATIGSNLSVGTNATVGANLNVGANATIGNNLTVGQNTTIGNNLTVGNNIVIGNNLIVGDNAQIGGNLLISGLVSSGNLNSNTVITTTMINNAVSSSGANSVPSSPAFVTTSPTANVFYSMGCNVSITTTQTTNSFLISCLTDPQIIFSGATSFGVYYLLKSRVVCVDPGGNVTYPITTSTPVIGNSNFTDISYRLTVPQYLSATYTGTGTYTFYLQQAWDQGNGVNTPTTLQDQGRALTVTLLKR